jgi:hypothetical protein
MKTTDVIRNVLDLIDGTDCDVELQFTTIAEPEVNNND